MDDKILSDEGRRHLEQVSGVGYHPDIRVIKQGTSGRYAVRDAVGDDGEQYFHQVLTLDGRVVASNDPMGLEQHSDFLKRAHGWMLLSGLGCGELLWELLKNPKVEHVTVVEKELDIINLVGDSFGVTFDSDAALNTEQEKSLVQSFGGFCDWQRFTSAPKPGLGVKRSGRPRKDPSSLRSVRKGVRFTPDEAELVTEAADSGRERESALIHRGAVREARRVLKKGDR